MDRLRASNGIAMLKPVEGNKMPCRIVDVSMSGVIFFFFSSRRRHTRFDCDWSSDVCSSDLVRVRAARRDNFCIFMPQIYPKERALPRISFQKNPVGADVRRLISKKNRSEDRKSVV